MKCNYLILITFVAASVCLLQIGCQEQAALVEESKPGLTAPKPATPSAKIEASAEPNGPAPEITFEKTIHDFGSISLDSKNVCEFKFTNTGDGLLKVKKKIKSTCGCTVPELSKGEYAPGEGGTVKVSYKAGKRPGSVKRRLFVYSNDKARPKVELTIKAKIIEKVDFKPKRLNLALNKENAGCPEITLSSLDKKPFAIKRFKSTGNCIIADYDSSEKATRFVLQPKVDMEKVRKGLNGRIEITLIHPESSVITIPFKVLPRFEIEPRVIAIFNAEPQKPVKKEVRILNNYDEDFEVESTSTREDGIIRVLGQEKIDKSYKFELEVTPPSTEGKKRMFSDVFFVNVKGGERLKISCRGFYSKKAEELSSTN